MPIWKRPRTEKEKQRLRTLRLGLKASEETKRKMSVAKKGKKMPEGFGEKLSRAKKGISVKHDKQFKKGQPAWNKGMKGVQVAWNKGKKYKATWAIKKGIRTRENNPRWKGGRFSSRGYIKIKQDEHPNADQFGYVFEHRYKMEQKIGRLLERNEIAHHLNGVKDDNRIENLLLMTKKEHDKLTNSMRIELLVMHNAPPASVAK